MGWIEISIGAIGFVVGVGAFAVLIARERKANRRFRVLAEIASVSDDGGSLEETLARICEILVPELADFCMLDVFEDGRVRRVAVRVAPDADPEVERWLWERRPTIPDRMVDGDGPEALAPQFWERMSDSDYQDIANDDDGDLARLREFAPRSAITLALNARGKVTGALTMAVSHSGRRYRAEDARFAWILSGSVALALDNCGLFADLERAERARAEIAETLQRGLLPPPLPHIPGWSIGAMYQPAGAENEVGGDFYDAFRVPGGWILAIGDVTGRGAHAASITAVARYTLRTAAALTGDPILALSTLNQALLARGDLSLCSLVALAISEDPAQPVRLAVAGHPPPLVVHGDEVAEAGAKGPLLGAFADAHWDLVEFSLELGQQLVVVTDGITEAEGEDGRFGEERLHRELRGAGDPSLVMRRLEAALNAFTGGRHDDDVAILALTRNSGEVMTTVPPGVGATAPAAPVLDSDA